MKLPFPTDWALFFAGFAAVAACSSGADPAPGGVGASGSGGAGGSSASTSTSGGGGCDGAATCSDCASCARLGPCASQSDTCMMNPDCILMDACATDCGGQSGPCETLCEAAHAQGVPAFKALRACEASACPMSCGAGGA